MNARIRLPKTLLGGHVLCAVSGGADSVALLRLLCESRDRGEIRLSAAHMEHGIRGESSVLDCEFVKSLCLSLGVPLRVCSVNVPFEAEKAREGMETCARRLRYEFLRKTQKEIGADAIALAHHLNDQAETVLMHLLRGSGLSGARGMREADSDTVRPLMAYTHAELVEYLLSVGQEWREDETNAENDTPRNFLRNAIFPKLEAVYPGAARSLVRFSRIWADEDEYMARAARKEMENRAEYYAGVCRIRGASRLDPAILRRVIREALPGMGFEDAERALAAVFADGSRRAELSLGANAWSVENDLYLLPPFLKPEPKPVPDEGECALDGVCRLTVKRSEPVPVRDDPYEQTLNAECLENALLRTRLDGDFICPLGMAGKRKSLSDALTDRKFPRPLRDRMPVIARGSEILWAAGLGISEHAKICVGQAAKRLKIRMNTSNGGKNHA